MVGRWAPLKTLRGFELKGMSEGDREIGLREGSLWRNREEEER